jgi:hypothetical protein
LRLGPSVSESGSLFSTIGKPFSIVCKYTWGGDALTHVVYQNLADLTDHTKLFLGRDQIPTWEGDSFDSKLGLPSSP